MLLQRVLASGRGGPFATIGRPRPLAGKVFLLARHGMSWLFFIHTTKVYTIAPTQPLVTFLSLPPRRPPWTDIFPQAFL